MSSLAGWSQLSGGERGGALEAGQLSSVHHSHTASPGEAGSGTDLCGGLGQRILRAKIWPPWSVPFPGHCCRASGLHQRQPGLQDRQGARSLGLEELRMCGPYVPVPQGQPRPEMGSAQCTAPCTSTSRSSCSVRAATPSPAGTASSMPTRTTSESRGGVGALPVPVLSAQAHLCPPSDTSSWRMP